ncbi:MAG TPA: hypothetical protein VL485_12920 [Ktedonobacteraceae bacterium]|jgi:hypothetical protein|nr:hypothetical protein [Ktedonobacteraceae bacterium]
MGVVLAVNSLIATLGGIAAIILCLFVFVFVLTALAFNLAMIFGFGWVREKAELIKLLRPSVESVNKASESVLQGKPLSSNENSIIRAVAQVPVQVTAVDKKVGQVSDSVAEKVIEYRARTVQAKAIVKTFFAPRRTPPALPESHQEIKSPGYHFLIEDGRAPENLKIVGDQDGLIAEQRGTTPQAKNAAHR